MAADPLAHRPPAPSAPLRAPAPPLIDGAMQMAARRSQWERRGGRRPDTPSAGRLRRPGRRAAGSEGRPPLFARTLRGGGLISASFFPFFPPLPFFPRFLVSVYFVVFSPIFYLFFCFHFLFYFLSFSVPSFLSFFPFLFPPEAPGGGQVLPWAVRCRAIPCRAVPSHPVP